MRVAIPLDGSYVAPRFCAADELLVVELAGGVPGERVLLRTPGLGFAARLQLLREQGVSDLLCGGFNRRYLPLAEALGIRVHWGLWGEAERWLRAFAAGEPLEAWPPRRGPGRGFGRRGGGRRGGGRGGGWRR